MEGLLSTLGGGGGGSSSDILSQLANGNMSLSQIGGSSAASSEPPVWLGKRTVDTSAPTNARTGARAKIAQPDTLSAAKGLPYTWSEKQRQRAYERVGDAIGTKITSFSQFLEAWEGAVDMAAQSWQATGGQNPLTPWDVFDLTKREGQKYGYGGDGGKQPYTVTQTNRTVNELSDGSVWEIAKAAAQRSLGRNPTHEEVRTFAARANAIAAANPSETVTTTHVDAEGNQTSSTQSKQGAGVDDFTQAADDEMDTAEAGAYQASTVYFDAMLRGLNSVV